MKESDNITDDFDDSPELRGIFEAALEISRLRGELLHRLRDALLANDDKEAISLARQYCGLEDWQIREHAKKRAKKRAR